MDLSVTPCELFSQNPNFPAIWWIPDLEKVWPLTSRMPARLHRATIVRMDAPKLPACTKLNTLWT